MGGVLAILLVFVKITFDSLCVSLYVPTFHLDGAFQTASGLFRLNMGQAPGKDFLPYLGIGPIVLLWPIFKLTGGDLAASVLSAHFCTLLLGWFAVSLLVFFIFRLKSFCLSCVVGAFLFFGAEYICRKLGIFSPCGFYFSPGNSLRPIRAVEPYLIAILSYVAVKNFRGYVLPVLFGAIIGIASLWSNDYAIPTSFVFGLFFIFYFFKIYEKSCWQLAVAFVFSCLISIILFYFVATAGRPEALIKYNFIDVATDQWWYFAPYSDGARIFSIGQLRHLVSRENFYPLIILIGILFYAIKTKDIKYILCTLIGISLFLGGCVASVGGHVGGYFVAFNYWGWMVTIVGGLAVVSTLLFRNWYIFNRKLFGTCICIICCLLLTIVVISTYRHYVKIKNKIDGCDNIVYVEGFGGFMDDEWAEYIDFIQNNKHALVVEEYWGLWSSLNKQLSNWPVDAAIHALGDVRYSARKALLNADFVVTTRYKTSPEWQPWSLSENFWLYDNLLRQWKIVFVSPTTIVWNKLPKPRISPKVQCRATDSGNGFVVFGDNGFYRVKLNYSRIGNERHLFMVKNNISYAADAHGYVSMPINKNEAVIPVRIKNGVNEIFDTKTVGSERVSYKILSCSAEKITFRNNEVLIER